MDFSEPVILGKTSLSVGRLGLGAGYGASAPVYEHAFDRGCNYFYWSSRKSGMKTAIRNICAKGDRDRLVISVQSYSRFPSFLEHSLNRALKSLKLDHVDAFILGWHNKPPSERLLNRALKMKEKGMFRFLGMSGHHRPLFARINPRKIFDLFHIRYNAAHRGAETETFPYLKQTGAVTYTATRWGHLLNPKKMPPNVKPPSSADCYRFVLSNPAVHLCLCGPKNMAQVDEALKTLSSGPMDDTELDHMRTIGDFVHQNRSFF